MLSLVLQWNSVGNVIFSRHCMFLLLHVSFFFFPFFFAFEKKGYFQYKWCIRVLRVNGRLKSIAFSDYKRCRPTSSLRLLQQVNPADTRSCLSRTACACAWLTCSRRRRELVLVFTKNWLSAIRLLQVIPIYLFTFAHTLIVEVLDLDYTVLWSTLSPQTFSESSLNTPWTPWHLCWWRCADPQNTAQCPRLSSIIYCNGWFYVLEACIVNMLKNVWKEKIPYSAVGGLSF